VPFRSIRPHALVADFRSPREATQDRPLHTGDNRTGYIAVVGKRGHVGPPIVRALLVTGLWLCLGCVGPLQQWGEDTAFHRKTTSFDPATLKQERAAVVHAVVGFGLEGYAHQVSRSLSSALEQRPAQITALPAHESLNRINRAGLTPTYADMAAAYAKTGILNRAGLQELGVALQAGYVFQPKQHQDETLREDLDVDADREARENRVGMTRHRFLLVAAPALLLAWLLTPLAASTDAGQESPTAVVRATLEAVLHLLDDPQLKPAAQAKHRRHLLEQVIAERFDYEEMSKRTLAVQWKALNDRDRQEFVQLFKAFLSDEYAARIEGYAGERIVYVSERTANGYAEVRTRLVSDKLDLPMDYRLTGKQGTWYAYDVIVDGVSLVMNYRSQFTKIIAESSFQELLRRLRERPKQDLSKPKP